MKRVIEVAFRHEFAKTLAKNATCELISFDLFFSNSLNASKEPDPAKVFPSFTVQQVLWLRAFALYPLVLDDHDHRVGMKPLREDRYVPN